MCFQAVSRGVLAEEVQEFLALLKTYIAFQSNMPLIYILNIAHILYLLFVINITHM